MDHDLELISPILEILEIEVCNILYNPGNISGKENGVEIDGVKDFLGISSRSMIHRGFSIAVSSRSGNFLTALAGSRCLLQAPTSCQSPMTCKNTPSPLLRHRAILSPCV